MRPITLTLLGNPRGKGAVWRHPKGWSVKDPKTRVYEGNLQYVASVYMINNKLMPNIDDALAVEIDAWLRIPKSMTKKNRILVLAGKFMHIKKPDWDNLGKICDALTGVVWRDDAQIVRATVTKRYSDRPRLVVRISTVDFLEPDTSKGCGAE